MITTPLHLVLQQETINSNVLSTEPVLEFQVGDNILEYTIFWKN